MVRTATFHAVGRNNQEVSYTYIQPGQTRSRAICFFCPGSSYLFDKPYLHYSTMLMLSHQADIVHIHYAYGKDNIAFGDLSMEERSQWMQPDVHAVVTKVLAEQPYEQIFFLGKSIGTMPIIDGLLQNPEFSAATAILLTPILTSEQVAANLLKSNHPVYLVIGSTDHFYQEPLLEKLRETKPNVHLHIVPGANHSLEVGWDLKASLTVFEEVMTALDDFVTKQLRMGITRSG
ncbi:alpha/beta family hydrolase [Brevibacillus choshinensis]|uniref:Alpha/beta hydrolase n=1 Tax=Brevibacillus choshinensis TaxID=54911 RepID=A0ABX7FT17_BRECH|nr:alpha/beta family hydrolase [Brevibacillus choshinensis]QRG69378.1 alpha/beta hydrolase [Brevibacillus choshinensis]